jgi:hypothetical protein
MYIDVVTPEMRERRYPERWEHWTVDDVDIEGKVYVDLEQLIAGLRKCGWKTLADDLEQSMKAEAA